MGKPHQIIGATGERLRWLREKNGKSQMAVAVAIGVDQTAISQYERSQCMPTHATLLNLANYFDVDLDYLIGRTGERKNINR